MKSDIFIITGKEIYSKNKTITFIFEFDSGIDFDIISEYSKYGMIRKQEYGWMLTAGKHGKMVYTGGINVIEEECFKDTVYLMKESESAEFLKEYGNKIDYEIFHSGKTLKQQ